MPLWVLVTKLTFGELTYFYKSILPVLQEKVLENILDDYHSEFDFQVSFPTSTLINNFNDMLDTLVSYRNICAHGDRLYNHRVRKGKHTRKLLFFHLTTPKGSETSLWGIILTLRLFLPCHDYKCMIQNMVSAMSTLSTVIPQQQFNLLLSKMGLTLQWRDSLLSLI